VHNQEHTPVDVPTEAGAVGLGDLPPLDDGPGCLPGTFKGLEFRSAAELKLETSVVVVANVLAVANVPVLMEENGSLLILALAVVLSTEGRRRDDGAGLCNT